MNHNRINTRPASLGHDEKGSALFLALAYLTAMTILVSVAFSAVHQSMKGRLASERHMVTLAIAEGGLEKALWELERDPGGYRGETGSPLGEGRFSVTVDSNDEHGTYTVAAVGERASDGRTTYSVAVEARVLIENGEAKILSWSAKRVLTYGRTPK